MAKSVYFASALAFGGISQKYNIYIRPKSQKKTAESGCKTG